MMKKPYMGPYNIIQPGSQLEKSVQYGFSLDHPCFTPEQAEKLEKEKESWRKSRKCEEPSA